MFPKIQRISYLKGQLVGRSGFLSSSLDYALLGKGLTSIDFCEKEISILGIGFNYFTREHINMHRPSIIALVETRISGTRAQATCDKIGFSTSVRVEAQGFQGGIWVL